MTELRTTAEGYLLAIECDAMSFETVTAWVDTLMTELDDPPPAVVEACCAGDDRNQLLTELRQFPGDLDMAAACKQMFFHMKNALAADPSLEGPIVNKLYTLASDQRDIPDAATNVFMRDLERDLQQADDAGKTALRAKLLELLTTQGEAPPSA